MLIPVNVIKAVLVTIPSTVVINITEHWTDVIWTLVKGVFLMSQFMLFMSQQFLRVQNYSRPKVPSFSVQIYGNDRSVYRLIGKTTYCWCYRKRGIGEYGFSEQHLLVLWSIESCRRRLGNSFVYRRWNRAMVGAGSRLSDGRQLSLC